MKCLKCGEEKEDEQFNFRSRLLSIRHKRCTDCTRKYGKNFYHAHRRERIALSAKRVPATRQRDVERLVEFLNDHPCVDCGERDPLVLDFDHTSGSKVTNVAQMLSGCSWKTIQEEIAKCHVRCANCHRRKTARERGWKKVAVIEKFVRRIPIG